jgi:thioredoxin reductase (NADPH)
MIRTVDVVIIGGGPAGISAALWCKRLGLNHVLLESRGSLGGQLSKIYNEIIDYPGLPGANGQELLAFFEKHIIHSKCAYQLNTSVSSINLEEKTMQVKESTSNRGKIQFKYVVIATGSSSRKLDIAGEKSMIERGEVYSASRDGEQFTGKSVAVVGGGDRAFEGALLLAEKGARVFLIHRSKHFRAREEYRQPALEHCNITLLTDTIVSEIYGNDIVRGIQLKEQNGTEKQLQVDGVFVRIGMQPNNTLLQGVIQTDAEGYIQVNEVGQTSHPFIFAIGDVCTKPFYSSIVSAAGQGMTASKQISLLLDDTEKHP